MTCDYNQTLKEKNVTNGDIQKLNNQISKMADDGQRLKAMFQKQTRKMIQEKSAKEFFMKEIEQMKFAMREGVKLVAQWTEGKVCPANIIRP